MSACWPARTSRGTAPRAHDTTCQPHVTQARRHTHRHRHLPPYNARDDKGWFLGRPPLPVQRRPRTTKPSTSRYDAVHQPSNYDVVHQPLPRRPQAITIKVHQPLQRRPQAITIKVHQPLPQPPQRGPQATSPSSTSHDNAVHKPLRRRPAPHNHTAPSMPRGGARRRPLEPALPDDPQLPTGERTARAWQRWFRAIKVNQGRLTPKPGLPGEEAIFPDPRVFTSAQFSVEAVQGLKGDCLRLTVSAVRNLHFDKKSWNPKDGSPAASIGVLLRQPGDQRRQGRRLQGPRGPAGRRPGRRRWANPCHKACDRIYWIDSTPLCAARCLYSAATTTAAAS
jgi:hypothetical protein